MVTIRTPEVGMERNAYMVLASFKEGTDMSEVLSIVAEEQQRVAQLQNEGRLGAVYLATATRKTVFLEVFATDLADAASTVRTLPMAQWWNIDVFELNAPAKAAAAS